MILLNTKFFKLIGVDDIIEHKKFEDMIWMSTMFLNTKNFKVGFEVRLIVKISEQKRIQHLLQQEEFANKKNLGKYETINTQTRLDVA
jgi:hypothetical protein